MINTSQFFSTPITCAAPRPRMTPLLPPFSLKLILLLLLFPLLHRLHFQVSPKCWACCSAHVFLIRFLRSRSSSGVFEIRRPRKIAGQSDGNSVASHVIRGQCDASGSEEVTGPRPARRCAQCPAAEWRVTHKMAEDELEAKQQWSYSGFVHVDRRAAAVQGLAGESARVPATFLIFQ